MYCALVCSMLPRGINAAPCISYPPSTQYQLDEGVGEVVVAGLSLGPEEGRPARRGFGLGVEGEVDVAGDDGGVKFGEPVVGDLVLQLLLGNALVAHGQG